MQKPLEPAQEQPEVVAGSGKHGIDAVAAASFEVIAAANVRNRALGHEKWPEWRRYLHPGQELCLNVALIYGDHDRGRAEAAMIRQHQPPCNSAYRDSFPFDMTTVTTSGANALMYSVFTVHRSENALASMLSGLGGRW